MSDIQKITPRKEFGMETFQVKPGTHTIVLDLEVIKKKAIVEFLNEQSVRYKKHSSEAIDEDIALAIGWFDISVEDIYGKDSGIKNISDLNDSTLAKIVRLRIEREEKNRDSTE